MGLPKLPKEYSTRVARCGQIRIWSSPILSLIRCILGMYHESSSPQVACSSCSENSNTWTLNSFLGLLETLRGSKELFSPDKLHPDSRPSRLRIDRMNPYTHSAPPIHLNPFFNTSTSINSTLILAPHLAPAPHLLLPSCLDLATFLFSITWTT